MQVALGNHDFGRVQQGFSSSKKMPLETKHSLAAPLGLRQLGPSFFASQRLQAVCFGFQLEANNVFDLKKLKGQLLEPIP